MNQQEDIYLYGRRKKILKETYLEVETLSNYLKRPHSLNADNITLDRIWFQIDWGTALHYFCLDSKILPLILDLYAHQWKDYLTSILMKNNKGESPLEITIKNDYSKHTEMMLNYLNMFGIEFSFSRLFY